MIYANSETLHAFKTDLWKDQRKLETRIIDKEKYIVKHYESKEEAQLEKSVLEYPGV